MSCIASYSVTNATGVNSNITLAGWDPTEENEDEKDKHPSYSGSGIDDDEDFVTSTSKNNNQLHENNLHKTYQLICSPLVIMLNYR